jgi:tetratricopeptide (TPR) repeat protein
MMGICVAVVWGLSEATEAFSINLRWRVAVAAFVLGSMALVTWRQVGYWKSSVELWTRDLKVTHSHPISEVNLGMSLLGLGRDDEAYIHFQRALVLQPNDRLALFYSGIYLGKRRHYEEAVENLQKSLRVGSLDASRIVLASRALGIIYLKLGDRAQARANFIRAVQTSPDDLADAQWLDQLDLEDAIDKEKLLLASHPSARGYLDLGNLLQQGGRIPDARIAYEHVLQLDPRSTEAEQALRTLKEGQSTSTDR